MQTDMSAFVVDFLLGGAAAVSKTVTAPIERVCCFLLFLFSFHLFILDNVVFCTYILIGEAVDAEPTRDATYRQTEQTIHWHY